MNFNNTSDFVSSFWSIYVVLLGLASILGCGVFLLMQDRAKTSQGNTTGHVWDETLQEYNNPLPNWWRWMFYLTVIFSLIYLALFPGLGSFAGKFGWTMRGQYDAEMNAAQAKYGPIFDKFLKMDIKAVAADPQGKEIGQRLFLTHCASCHGSDAKGVKGFPNLTDKVWIWGGSAERIEETIANGRDAVMTPKGVKPDMDAEQVRDVVAYVRSLAGMSADSVRAQRGKDIYPQACAACHGADAKGNPAAGYPNLTIADPSSRIYGASEAEMIETVTHGRTNRMPAWKDFLGDAKVHLLSAYVWSLGGGEASADDGATAVLEGNTAKIFFASGKADLNANAKAVVAQLFDLAKANPNAKFVISGYHDATGDAAVNAELAKNRAQQVADALLAAGVAQGKIELKKPEVTQGSGDNKAARRVEATII